MPARAWSAFSAPLLLGERAGCQLVAEFFDRRGHQAFVAADPDWTPTLSRTSPNSCRARPPRPGRSLATIAEACSDPCHNLGRSDPIEPDVI